MITSTANPLVKDLVRLRTRRDRDREGRFLIEGQRPLSLAVESGTDVIHQVVCPGLGGHPLEGVPVVELAEAPFRRVSLRQNPDGILGVAMHLDTSLPHLVLPPEPLVLVVEAIEKPGNLGAMLRTCDAVGVDAVIAADPTTDVHNPNVIQASQGALFTVAIAVSPLADVKRWLGRGGLRLVATTPGGHPPPWGTDLTGPVAVAIGAEDRGLSAETLASAHEAVSIPTRGRVDSLNASVAAGVVLYEAARQRHG